MKALSIREPWAHMVVHGLKTVEIRSWSTDYRGRLAIHAGLQADEPASRRFDLRELPAGALIGTARLEQVEPFTPATWLALAEEHLDAGPYRPGLFAWKLTDPRPLPRPVPCRGRLGIFEVELRDGEGEEPVAGEERPAEPVQGALFDLTGSRT